MARREMRDGSIRPDGLQDIKRGDKVCVTYWGGKYINTTVTRVRTVECATIVTVEKVPGVNYKRFVGYYTGRIAVADSRTILTMDTYWADMIDDNMKRAEERSAVIAKRADALAAMKTLKDWFFMKEDSIWDTDVE